MPAPKPILEPPESSRIRARELTRGVLLDFPYARASFRFPAGQILIVILGVSVAGLLASGLLSAFVGARFILFLAIPFAGTCLASGLGLAALIFVQGFSPGARRGEDRGTRQLGVADGILVRKSLSGRKDVWDEGEIIDIRSENYWEGEHLLIGVLLRSPDAEPVVLHGGMAFNEATELQRAELEWIAAQLRRALGIADDPLAPPPNVVPADAIVAKSPHVRRDD